MRVRELERETLAQIQLVLVRNSDVLAVVVDIVGNFVGRIAKNGAQVGPACARAQESFDSLQRVEACEFEGFAKIVETDHGRFHFRL